MSTIRDYYFEHAFEDDFIQVTRCKDCKHYNQEANVAYIAYCPMEDGEHLKPEDYCSYAERREESEDY